MYFDFYKLYSMVDFDLQVSGADSELYCTDASMHLVSHMDRWTVIWTVVCIKQSQLRINLNDFKILI